MVDFRQLNSQKKQPPVIEPRQLFQTLQRDKQHEYLRDIQGDVLNEWFGRRDERDLIIKMNTGSGKTLVGLVVLWSRLKEGKGPALYLCPNRHLVSQVRSEAEKLGIPHVDFEPNNLFPAGFYDSTSILVTTVQKLFNGLSVFRVADRPDSVTVGTILIDDAHTCINVVREQFTATFTKESSVGRRLSSFFHGSLTQQSVGLAADIDRGDHNAYLRVPYWTWQERLQDVAELFSGCSNHDELKFTWPFLKISEVLANSTACISGDRVEVAPISIPIELIPSFDAAPHRIYMSATLIDDAALIRDFAADPRSIEEPIKPKVGGYIGERLIVTPQLVDSSIDELTTIELVSRVSALHEANVVVLVPSNKRASIWKTDSSMEVTGTNISEVIERLACSSPNTAIIANRYDGIDLPDEACRVLVIDNLPQEDRLANLIEATVRRQSPFLKRQMAQRIEQGMGRGVRSIADYCVVVLMGRELVAFMTDVKNQAFLTEETKRQVEMGKGLSSMLKQSTNTSQAIMDLIAQCLDRDPDWQKFHRESLQDTETAKASDSDTVALATAELRAFKCAFGGQYDRAADEIGCLISERNGLSDNDTGWYLQLQAEYLHHVDPVTALEKQLKAQELNRNLLKPPDGINYRRIQSKATDQAYAVVEWATVID